MRPDEHKKKKNAAYKKKHGIGQAKGQGEESQKSKGSSKGKVVDTASNFGTEKRHNVGAASGKVAEDIHDSSQSDSDADEVKPRRKTFQRRQIVSNWQKYDLDPADDECPTTKGESFEKLLSMSGNASAHFRFKDEQDWDVGTFMLGDVGKQSDPSSDISGQYLSIDAQQLGQSLACLPLYQVLGVDAGVFPKEELERLNREAATQRELLMPSLPSSHSEQTNRLGQNISHDPATASGGETESSRISSSTGAQKHSQTVNLSRDVDPSKVSSHLQTDPTSNHICDAQSEINRRLTLQDEDLDALLDLDLDAPQTTQKTASIPQGKNRKENLPSQFTSAVSLSSHADTPSSSQTKQAVTAENANKPQKDGVDLEDWLDSILDD